MGNEESSVAAARAQLAAAVARVESDEVVDSLRGDLGFQLLRAGLPDAAIDELQLAAGSTAERLGEHDFETLDLLGLLGRAQTEAGRFDDAKATLRKVIAGRTRVLGADDPQTLVARGNLLQAIGRGGHPDEALEMVDVLLADRIRLLGVEDPSTLDTRGHRAQLLALVGRHDEAIAELELLLDDRIRILGDDHPVVASTRHNLASIRSRAGGDSDDAESSIWELEQNAAAISDRMGVEHPETLIAWGMLAEQLQRVGRDADALPLLDRLIEARTRVLGPDAVPTITSERMRCASLRRTGQVVRATAEARALLDRASAAFGPDALLTASVRSEWDESYNTEWEHPTPELRGQTPWGSERYRIRYEDDASRYSTLDVCYDANGDLSLHGETLGSISEDSDRSEYEYARTFSSADFPTLLEALGAAPGADVLDEIVSSWSGKRSHEMERRLTESGAPITHWSRP